jgi:hypothetical protein
VPPVTDTADAGPRAVAPATPRRLVVSPYIEASQILSADLKGGDTVTYTALAAGVDASIGTARTSAQASYRYEHQFGWGRAGDQDVHSGLARVQSQITRGLRVEGGALATRTRSDIRGDAPGILTGQLANISQIYSLYAGPSYADRVGVVDIGADYRIGYTKATTPRVSGLATTQPRLDYFDDSLNQLASARIGVAPGAVLPVGLTASGAYERDDAGQLDQRYEGYYARGDVLAPVSPYVALTAGAGYEKIETTQRDPLLTAAGTPALDGNGRFVTDPASPRRVAYRTDGLYYDAGVIWRPNRRTSVEGHVGRRYGTISYTGSARYQASRDVAFAAILYDGVQTFGRQLRAGLASLPTSFVAQRDAFGQQFGGCTFGAATAGDGNGGGASGGTPAGGCLNDVFQSLSTASYRARGLDAILTLRRGLSTYGVGAGYANRHLYAPGVPSGIVVSGLNDESWYAQAFYARALTPVSGIDTTAFVNISDSDLPGAETIYSVGATGSYYHYFGRLGTTAGLGLYSFRVGDVSSALRLQALIAARYRF